MPEQETLEAAERDRREGRSPSTQAGEFVREEIHHVREGKHGARSAKQAIAIGLSKARRSGVRLPLPRKGRANASTRRKAQSDAAKGRRPATSRPSSRRSRAMLEKLKREPRGTVSRKALSRHARSVARRRPASARSASARKAARTRKK